METEKEEKEESQTSSLFSILHEFLDTSSSIEALTKYKLIFKYLPVHGDCDKIRILLWELDLPIEWNENASFLAEKLFDAHKRHRNHNNIIRPVLEVRNQNDNSLVCQCEHTQAIFHVLGVVVEATCPQESHRWLLIIQLNAMADLIREELFRQHFYIFKGEITESVRHQMEKEWIVKFLGPALENLQEQMVSEVVHWNYAYVTAASSIAGLVILLENEFQGIVRSFPKLKSFLSNFHARSTFKKMLKRFPTISTDC